MIQQEKINEIVRNNKNSIFYCKHKNAIKESAIHLLINELIKKEKNIFIVNSENILTEKNIDDAIKSKLNEIFGSKKREYTKRYEILEEFVLVKYIFGNSFIYLINYEKYLNICYDYFMEYNGKDIVQILIYLSSEQSFIEKQKEFYCFCMKEKEKALTNCINLNKTIKEIEENENVPYKINNELWKMYGGTSVYDNSF